MRDKVRTFLGVPRRYRSLRVNVNETLSPNEFRVEGEKGLGEEVLLLNWWLVPPSTRTNAATPAVDSPSERPQAPSN
jgi:hypothetical protein